ncbi:MAG: acyltransferase family protein, partial [Pseudomonadota bacterium]
MIAEPVRDRPLDDSHFSLYLDLCRFLAALAVLLGHLHFDGFAAAAIWHQFSHEAVIIFFVISGVVIAHSAEGRSWQAYLAARASRLYAVIIPALMFSILLAGFIGPGWPDGTQKVAEWKLTELPLILAFLSQSWLIGAEIPLNRPFWSLCYEAFYYLMFALYLYGGRRRFLWTGIAALVAGPAILALMPAWLAGVWLHHRIVDHRVPVPRSVAVVTMVMIVAICALRIPDLVSAWVFERYPIWYVLRSSTQVLTDLPIAALFVLHL